MNEEQTDKLRNKRKRKAGPKRLRPRHRFGIWQIFGIVILVVLMLMAGMMLTGSSIVLPNWATQQLQQRMNAALPNGRITIGQTLIQVNKRGVPGIRLHNLGIFDARGAEVVRLNDVETRLSASALLQGQIKLDSFKFSGAQMTLRRRSDGQFDVSFGGDGGTTTSLAGLLDIMDGVFAEAPLDSVGRVDAQELTINVEDGRTGRLWQITDGQMHLERLKNGLDLAVSFDVFNGTEDLAEVVLGIRTSSDTSAATIGATFKNASAADIALQTPVLSFLGVLVAPISGAVRAGFGDNGALTNIAGTLEIGSGVLQPTRDTPPVGFESSKVYFDYDPSHEKITFSELSVETDAVSLVANGQAYLQDFVEGWPSSLLAQISIADLRIDPTDVFDQPVTFSQGAMDFRLNLDPFTVDIGQIVLVDGDETISAKGSIATKDNGWDISTDLKLNQIGFSRLMALWPPVLVPKTRKWLSENVFEGRVHDVNASLRLHPGETPTYYFGFRFEDATVRYMKKQPNIEHGYGFGSIEDKRFTLMLESGEITAPKGGKIALAGSKLTIGEVTQKPATMKLDLIGKSSITAAVSLLDLPPFKILKNARFPVDLADGQIDFVADAAFLMKKKVKIKDVTYQVDGILNDVSTDVIVKDRTITSNALSLSANKKAVIISGPVRMGGVNGDVTWHQKMGPKYVGFSKVSGTVDLTDGFAEEFNLGLPKGAITGNGTAKFEIEFQKEQPPTFSLQSELAQTGIAIDAIGWRKSTNTTGDLDVTGTLGETPDVDHLSLSAPGLDIRGGRVTLRKGGSLKTATFERVRVGDWLDAPVTLKGRADQSAPTVEIDGGVLDIRKTSFGGAGGTTSKPTGGPINLSMDRVIISEGITLTDFDAKLNSNNGLSGKFSARVNGRTPIDGTLVTERNGVAIRIKSNDAGALARDADLIDNAFGGSIDITLRPTTSKGVYNGRLEISDTRVVNASALAELLNVVSIVGLLDQLSGPGILFTDVVGDFILSPTSLQLQRASAVGPSIGVSLDGFYNLTNSRLNMQGVLSPIYFLNSIGRIFSPRDGEGLFGFAFRIDGTADNPKVSVNPLSILTPGMFREIFRTQPPNVKK